MDIEVETFVRNLDLEASKLPQLKDILPNRGLADACAFDPKPYFSGFVTNLKKILETAKAKDIEEYYWHQYISPVRFDPTASPYFRVGHFGECEDVVVNENLRGVISVGFDEGLDYEPEHVPDLVLFYLHDEGNSDVNLYTPKEWRKAVNEFFDISKFIKIK